MTNYVELSKKVDALILDNASIICENHKLKKELEAMCKENKTLAATGSDLVEKNKELQAILDAWVEENNILYKKNSELSRKIKSLELLNEALEEEIEALEEEIEALEEEIEALEEENEGLDNECQKLSDALEEDEGQVIHYVAVSLDLELCVPLVSENPIQAGQELINKCLAKGVSYGGFKVFEKSELL